MSATVAAAPLAVVLVALVAHVPAARADEDEDRQPRSWSEHWLVGPRATATLAATGDDTAREHAAERLGTDGAPRAAARALAAAAHDDEVPAVADAALDALVRRGGSEAVDGLVDALAHASGRERLALRHALSALGGDAASRAVIASISAGDPDGSLADDLARLGPGAVPRLLRAATDDRYTPPVLLALGTIGDARALGVLRHALLADQTNVRAAAATALGRLGDPRASPALVAALADPAPSSTIAVLGALAKVGEPAAVLAVRRRLSHPDPAVRAAALQALVALDAPGSVQALSAALAGPDVPLAAAARALLVSSRHPAMAPLLAARLVHDPRPAEVAGALAVVDDGAGVSLLLAAADHAGPTRVHVLVALAVAARTHGARLDGATRDAIHAALVRGGAVPSSAAAPAGATSSAAAPAAAATPSGAPLDPDTALVVRALARDAGVAPYLVVALASPRAVRRATAGHALALLAGTSGWDTAPARAALARALASETDDEAYRREASAAAALSADVPLDAVLEELRDDGRAAEAVTLAASLVARAAPAARRRALVALHEALRAESPRTRAAAAHGIAEAEHAAGIGSLLSALTHERDTHVRHALARELGALRAAADPAHRDAVLGAARVARDPAVRDALVAAGGLALRGDEVLHVRFESRSPSILADVLLPDGHAVRIAPLPSGDLLLADLPLGDADVVAVERAP